MSLLLRLVTTGVSGTIAATNGNDTSAFAGSPVISGTIAAINANDSMAASGSVIAAMQQGFWAANPYKFRSAKQLREEERRLIQEERELLGILPKKVAKQVVKVAVNDAWRPTSDQIEALEAALYDARLGHIEEAVKVLRMLIQRQEEEILLFLM